MHKLSKAVLYTGKILFGLVILWIISYFLINITIIQITKKSIIQASTVTTILDYVVIPWASVQGLRLSPILQDRVETAIHLYQNKKAKKIIISWDNREKNYKEVDAMYNYLLDRGVLAIDIIKDTKWYDTFETMYNIKHADYKTGTIGIVTQNYHLPRAIFIANALWLEVIGVESDRTTYIHEESYRLRETFARIKSLLEIIRYYIKW